MIDHRPLHVIRAPIPDCWRVIGVAGATGGADTARVTGLGTASAARAVAAGIGANSACGVMLAATEAS